MEEMSDVLYHGSNVEQALRAVYNSELYQKLCDPKTGLYFQSHLYVYDYLKTEIKTGKLQ